MKPTTYLGLCGVFIVLLIADNLSEAATVRTKRSIAGLQRLIQSLPIQGGEEKKREFPQVSDNQDEATEGELREKRYFCRKYFIYNPVNGRCIPTLRAFRGKGKRPQRFWNQIGQGI